MPSIFSRDFGSFVSFLWRNVYSKLLPIFKKLSFVWKLLLVRVGVGRAASARCAKHSVTRAELDFLQVEDLPPHRGCL